MLNSLTGVELDKINDILIEKNNMTTVLFIF